MKSKADFLYDSRKESIRQLSKGDFIFKDCSGFLVSVTSKNTGRSMTRFCKDENESEKFIDYASCLVDEDCQAFWYRIELSSVRSCDFSETE